MFQLSAATRIYLAVGATDMRKSFDTLCGIVHSWRQNGGSHPCEGKEGPDPLDGSLYVFCNRRRDRIKVLFFDGLGLWVCAKRLEKGAFSWPEESEERIGGGHCAINQQELALLLGGVDMERTKLRRWWRRT